MAKSKSGDDPKPAQQGVSPISGTAPPAEYRWQPGESGNPKGRPSAGATIREWINQLVDTNTDDLRKIVEDAAAPVAKKTAARLWLDASSTGVDAIGKPIAGVEFDRIMDRTEGKPAQHTHLTSDGTFREEPTVLERLPGADKE